MPGKCLLSVINYFLPFNFRLKTKMFKLPQKPLSKAFLVTLFVTALIYAIYSFLSLKPSHEYIMSMDKQSSEITSAGRRHGFYKKVNVSKEEANVENDPLQVWASPQFTTIEGRESGDKHFENSKFEYSGKPQSQQVNLNSNQQMIRNRFLTRNQAAKNVCNRYSSEDLKKNYKKSKDFISLFAFKRFSWCHVPKVGTTFLNYLNRKALGKYPNSSYPLRPARPRDAFFLVREPYSRMVSGYIGKIVTNQPWWIYYGTYITGMFRANATSKQKKCGNDVSFPEFVKYFIHSQVKGQRKNHHFQPMYELCNPCRKHYDFIVHLETLSDDLSYILRTVNITTNLSFSDEEQTMGGKARSIVSQRKKIVSCESMCAALRKVWWSFHARGLISKDIEFPVREDECDNISPEDFAKLSIDAHTRSIGRIDKSKQKRQALVELFLQVPLEDRIKVRDLLALDFQLFGYDPQPDDIFPELTRA